MYPEHNKPITRHSLLFKLKDLLDELYRYSPNPDGQGKGDNISFHPPSPLKMIADKGQKQTTNAWRDEKFFPYIYKSLLFCALKQLPVEPNVAMFEIGKKSKEEFVLLRVKYDLIGYGPVLPSRSVESSHKNERIDLFDKLKIIAYHRI